MRFLLDPRRLFPALFLIVFFPVLAVQAQVDRAGIVGTVKDASGAAVAGVTVEANSDATGLRRQATTNELGVFSIQGLPIGVYTVRMQASGFAAVTYKAVTVNVGEVLTLDCRLNPSETQEVVEVTASSEERSNATIGIVISPEQIKGIPLNGRHWASLMALAPGAVNSGSGNQNTIRFNGRSRDDNNWTFDGVDQTGVKDPRQEENLRLVTSLESIAEFRVNTHTYGADQGNGSGGQVNLVSKSGTNQFHGSLFHFIRNSALDARNFFDGRDIPQFQLNQFGGSLGGPVIKDKTFFFFSFEGLRQRRGLTFISPVPSQAFVQRALAGPQGSVIRPLLNLFPAGNIRTSNPDVDNLSLVRKSQLDETNYTARVDHRFNDRRSLFFRFSVDDADAFLPLDDVVRRRDFTFRPANYVFQYQEVFSPSLIYEGKIGVNRSPLVRFDGTPGLDQGPRVDGVVRLRPNIRQREIGTTFGYINNFTYTKGRHTVRFGGEFRRIRLNGGETGSTEFRFRSLNDLLANRLDNIEVVTDQGTYGVRRNYFLPYVQDDFKVKANLTVNLGLRYEYYSVPFEVNDKGRVFALSCNGFCPPGTSWYEADRNNFAPRLGIAWAPTALNNKTVVRGGYGIYYSTGQNDDVISPTDNIQDRFQVTRSVAPTLSFPVTPFLTQGVANPRTPRALALDRREMYTHSFGVSVTQELPLKLAVTVGYVGSIGRNVFTRNYVNLIDPVTRQRPLPNIVVDGRTFPLGEVDIKNNLGSTDFHGLQVSVRRRFSGGFQIGSEYMWSKALGNTVGSGDNSAGSDTPQNARDLDAERARTNFDVRHTSTTNFLWELPFGRGRRFLNGGGVGDVVLGGWDLSGIAVARTGRPITVTITRDPSSLPDGAVNTNQRPDIVPGVPLQLSGARVGDVGWINPAAFRVPANGRYGNAGRGILSGPALIQFDVAVAKTFRITETQRLTFRFETFNIFNRAQFDQPVAFLGSANAAGVLSPNSNFGRILNPLSRDIGTGTARSLQFSLRYGF